jgi:hypothetical protein
VGLVIPSLQPSALVSSAASNTSRARFISDIAVLPVERRIGDGGILDVGVRRSSHKSGPLAKATLTHRKDARLLLWDAKRGDWQNVALKRDSCCVVCGAR